MMKLKSAIAVVAVMTGCALSAAASATVAVDPPKQGDRSRRVCRTQEPTGTRFPERVCKTQQEWDEIAQRTRNNRERLDRNSRHGQTNNN